MSDLMFWAVLKMPYEMAMSDELSRLQFYQRVEEAVKRLERAEAIIAEQRPINDEIIGELWHKAGGHLHRFARLLEDFLCPR